MIKKSDICGAATYDALWEVFAWSMNQLMRGSFDRLDWEGREGIVDNPGLSIAGGYSGAIILMRGDWQFYGDVIVFRSTTPKQACAMYVGCRFRILYCDTRML